jgi:hypothetical protein
MFGYLNPLFEIVVSTVPPGLVLVRRSAAELDADLNIS